MRIRSWAVPRSAVEREKNIRTTNIQSDLFMEDSFWQKVPGPTLASWRNISLGRFSCQLRAMRDGRSRLAKRLRQTNDDFFDIVERVPARRAAQVRRDDHVGKFDQRIVSISRFFIKRIQPISAQPS